MNKSQRISLLYKFSVNREIAKLLCDSHAFVVEDIAETTNRTANGRDFLYLNSKGKVITIKPQNYIFSIRQLLQHAVDITALSTGGRYVILVFLKLLVDIVGECKVTLGDYEAMLVVALYQMGATTRPLPVDALWRELSSNLPADLIHIHSKVRFHQAIDSLVKGHIVQLEKDMLFLAERICRQQSLGQLYSRTNIIK